MGSQLTLTPTLTLTLTLTLTFTLKLAIPLYGFCSRFSNNVLGINDVKATLESANEVLSPQHDSLVTSFT